MTRSEKKWHKRALRLLRNNIRQARGHHERWMRTVLHGWTYSTSYIEHAHPDVLSPRCWRRRLSTLTKGKA